MGKWSKAVDDLEYNIKFSNESLQQIDEALSKYKNELSILEKHNQHCRAVRELNRKITESNNKIQSEIAAATIELVECEKKLELYDL